MRNIELVVSRKKATVTSSFLPDYAVLAVPFALASSASSTRGKNKKKSTANRPSVLSLGTLWWQNCLYEKEWNCSFSHEGEICYSRECNRKMSSHFCHCEWLRTSSVLAMTHHIPVTVLQVTSPVQAPLWISAVFCVLLLFWKLREDFVCLPFLSYNYLHSLACGPFFHLQSQQ